jgi:hypothetical protein
MVKRLFIAITLATASVGAVAFYYWQQATQLPAWYTANQIEPTGQPSQATATKPTVEIEPKQTGDRSATTAKPSAAPKPPTKAQRHQSELTQLFTTEITRKAESKKLGSALKGANTTMQNGTVESGAVVNLGDISPEQLPPDERAFFSKLVTAFPELSRQSFYIGVEGKPTVKNGQALLSDDLRVKLGNLSFTPAQLAERLGIPEDQIRQQLQLQVQLGHLKAKQSQLADDRPVEANGSN